MTASTTTDPAGVPAHAPSRVTVPPARLAWLSEEVRTWQGAGILEAGQVDAILAGYTAGRRVSLVRLLMAIGATFVGIGAIWLVAANIESLSPGARVALVALCWAAALIGGEVLAERPSPAPVVGAVRLVAAMLVGGLIFQAAQTLQVPAHEPVLVGCWAVAALLHAYAVGARSPLVVGVVTGTGYVVWAVLDSTWSGLGFALSLGAVALTAVSIAALHQRWLPRFGPIWREAGALLTLVVLVVAAFPTAIAGDWEAGVRTWVLLASSLAVALLATLRAQGLDRAEIGLTALALLGAVALVLWEAGADNPATPGTTEVTHAVLGVLLCAGAAVALAADGTLRDSSRLVGLATVALVAVTTLQAFTILAPVLEGAWLFLLLGAVLVGTGLLFDRGRRQLAAAL